MQREPTNAPSSTITGRACTRLEHAADADAAGEMDVGADLRARADRRPRVDHRVRPDPGADVDVARHQHDAGREERAVARRRRRHDAHAELRVVVLERDLVEVLERADLDRLELAQPEVLEDRRLRLLVHAPLAVDLLRDAHLAAVERRDRLLDVHHGSLPQDRRRALALLERRHEREADVALAARPEDLAGGDDDAALEQRVGVGPDDPEVHRRLARDDLPAARLDRRDQHVALRAVARARLLDVALVVPGDDRGALHELLRRRSDGRPVRLQRGDDLRRRRRRSRSGSRSSTSACSASGRRRRASGRRPAAPTAAARRTRARCTPRRRR